MINTKSIWSKAEQEAWKLPEDITVSQWAAKNRVLPEGSPFPGLYKLHLTPYMAGPMDAFCDDEVEEITMMFPSQISKSCSAQNMIGYIIDQCPGETFYVVPREKDVDYVTEKVFKPMVELSEALSRHTSGSPRDLQGDHFDFDRMTLYFGWAGSPAELAAKYIKYLFLDETNKYPPFAGKEANPIDLAIKRTSTFWDRKIIKISTPTRKGEYIDNSYNNSNMQKFYIPCPHCGQFSTWPFIQLKISPKLRDPDKIIKEGTGCVWYECEYCAHRIEENRKGELVAAGKWIPKGQTIDADGNIKGEPERSKRHSGFNAPAWIAPFDGVSWPRIMASWFKANTEEGIVLGELLNFKNSVEGVPFEETGKKLKTSELRKLVGGFSRGTVPQDCVTLVAAADYHKSEARGIVRIDYEIRGFGYGLKNYVITSGTVPSFEQLDKEVLLSPFPWSDGTSNEKRPWLPVVCLFIDSGYKPDDVYEYCRQRPGLTIPTKGEVGPCLKPLRPSELESATERRLTHRQRIRYRGMQLMIIDTSFFKNQVQSWAEPRLDEQGKIIAEPLTQFYDEIPHYYLTEFSNEQKVKVRDRGGNVKWIWKPVVTGAQTHSLDTAVLAAAAGFYKGVHYLRKPGEKKVTSAAAGQKKKIKLSELQRQKRLR